MLRTFMVALSSVVFATSLAARQPTLPNDPTTSLQTSADDYVGADQCKECHETVYKSWSETKHAKALNKLMPNDREGGKCIRCHVTGSNAMIDAEGSKPSFPHVQCEACHGAGKRHIEAARIGSPGDGPTTKVEESTCLRCHNEASPHYKPFFFNAMKGLVHR